MFKKDFGEQIPGLQIDGKSAPYGVLNERAVRATAWIMFAVWLFTMLTTYYTKDFTLLTFVVIWFFLDFFVKVFFGPKYSPLSTVWKFLVRKQKPEYVWAIQKRFAWTLGLIMSGTVIIITLIFWIQWILPLTLCSICLGLMWLETSVWICIWCKIYGFLLKKWIIPEPEHRPACPGWVCSLK